MQQQLDESRRQAVAAQQQMTTLQQQAAVGAAGRRRRPRIARRPPGCRPRPRRPRAATRTTRAARPRSSPPRPPRPGPKADRKTAEVATAAANLERQNAQLQQQNATLVQERDDLAGQLDHALSSVAQITKTARGVVVNLPDILFDINKATLKPNTQVALAKLAGIVAALPEDQPADRGLHGFDGHRRAQHAPVEGTRRIGADVSRSSRAWPSGRMTTVGYGPKFPVADNATVEGRARNRRVEIVLAEGAIQGAGTP